MRKDELYESFLDMIKEKIPQRGKLTNKLVDILFIEKEAVYRRLRGEVPFTFSEVVTIAKEFNFSLDSLIGTISSKSRPFQLKLIDYFNPTEIDYKMHEEFIDVLRVTRNGLYSEFGFVSSMLPLHFSVGYKYIYRFYVLRWMYQFGSPGDVRVYSDMVIPERQHKIVQDFLKEVQNVTYTFFIWDELIFYYLVNDIKYFLEIHLLTKDDVESLKQEMLTLINDMEQIAAKGSFSNGNKIHFYVSNLNFETTYTYLETSEYYLTLIKTFTLNETTSLDKEVFVKMKTWIQALKRTSTLISESGEVQRMLFFEKQRGFINEL